MNRRRIHLRLRIQFLALLMLMGMGSLGLRLWWIQVAHGAEWTAQLRGSSQATVRIPSVRGEIKDRNRLTLVQNRWSYEVDFYLPEMVKGYRERFGSPPLTEYRAIISGMPKDQKQPDIIKIVNDGIVPRLNELDLARDYNAGKLERHFRNDTEVPFSYIKDIDFPTMAKFWRWLLFPHSIQILSSRASRRRIGKRCRKMRPIHWLIVRLAACRQARHSSSSRHSPVCAARKILQPPNTAAGAE